MITDSAGNAWVKAGSYFVSGHFSDGELWYAVNANSATNVTVTLGSAAVVAVEVMEFSGVAATSPLDVNHGASNTGNSADSGSATPASTMSVAVGFIAGHGSTQAMTVTAPGYSSLPQQTSTNGTSTPASVVVAYRVMTSPGAADLTGSFSAAMYWAAGVAVFKAG